MFDDLDMAPADPILGLTEAFKRDPNPEKINLGVGVYKDEQGKTPVLDCVKIAERRLYETEDSKSYLGIDGAPELVPCVQELLFGSGHEIMTSARAVTAQSPGGTGALRVAADFIARKLPGARVWLSDPTWANHQNVFGAAGLETCAYPYYDAAGRCLAFDAMLAALGRVPAGDIVLFHACCHNPSGMDPSAEQWRALADAAARQRFLPLLDCAYQGFGRGLDEDAEGLRIMAAGNREMMVASSFSKNFGLYKERVGALTVVAGDADSAQKARSHVKTCIRANYSNPPAHGAAVVTAILSDSELRRMWLGELSGMRNRIRSMRALFVETLAGKGVTQDFSHIARQLGMFSFSGMTPEQVEALRERHSIYVVGSGRINVAGMTSGNMDRLCEAIADVLTA